MEITYTILFAFGAAIFGFLIGGIPTARIIAYSKGVDILKVGSKNAGGTNVGRSVGRWWGYLTRFLDRRKCFFPCLFVHLILSFAKIPLVNYLWLNELLVCITGLSVAIGHSYSIYSKFKGGKAVACFAGFILYTSPILFVIGFFLFLLLFKLSKRVSFASVITAPSMRLLSFIPTILNLTIAKNPTSYNGGTYFGPSLYLHLTYILGITYLFISTLLVLRHLSNIKRLEKGTEPETHFKD